MRRVRASPSLDQVERWVQEFIVNPADDESVASSYAHAAAELLLPSRTLSPIERVGIYRGMYLLRMSEAIRADFPALEHFLGASRFQALVKDYVEAHPSRSYTLSRLRDHLPAYLLGAASIPRRAAAHDLARLELAMCEVFDAPESPRLDPAALARALAESAAPRPPSPSAADPDPVTGWEQVRLRFIQAFALVSFRYPVNEYLQSVRDESPHPRVRRADSWVAVYRRDYSVWRLPLSKPAFDTLKALSRGSTVGEALRAASSRRRIEPDQVFKWFRIWADEGLFTALETGQVTRS
jgi:hypothetical protein